MTRVENEIMEEESCFPFPFSDEKIILGKACRGVKKDEVFN